MSDPGGHRLLRAPASGIDVALCFGMGSVPRGSWRATAGWSSWAVRCSNAVDPLRVHRGGPALPIGSDRRDIGPEALVEWTPPMPWPASPSAPVATTPPWPAWSSGGWPPCGATHQDEADITVEIAGADPGCPTVPTRSGRPVYDGPGQSIDYYDDRASCSSTHAGPVVLHCAPAAGGIRSRGHPIRPTGRGPPTHRLTIALLETMKRFGRFPLHAAGLSLDGRGMLVPGSSGAGKSTRIRCPWPGPGSTSSPTTRSSHPDGRRDVGGRLPRRGRCDRDHRGRWFPSSPTWPDHPCARPGQAWVPGRGRVRVPARDRLSTGGSGGPPRVEGTAARSSSPWPLPSAPAADAQRAAHRSGRHPRPTWMSWASWCGPFRLPFSPGRT